MSLLKIFYIDKLLFLASLMTSHSVTINTNALACLLYAVLSACRKSVVTDLGVYMCSHLLQLDPGSRDLSHAEKTILLLQFTITVRTPL